MSRVLGLHVVELRPGVTPEQFEHFVIDEYLPALAGPLSQLSGIEVHLLRCDRGEQEGQYIFMFEFESVEARDRYFPTPGVPGKALLPFIESLQPVTTKWEALSKRTKNDYVMLDG